MRTACKRAMLLGLAMAAAGCANEGSPRKRDVPEVYTTFYPTTYFARRIGGARIKVVCPLPAGEDAIFWMPDAETIAAYQQADLIVVNGAGLEKWLAKVSLPESRVVDTAKPFEKEFLKFKDAVTHSHGAGDEHSHEGLDGHTWLDPLHAKAQAGEIRKALAALLPDHKGEFQANYAALASDLDALDRSLAALKEKIEDQPLLASHPAYNYLAERYGWQITNLDLDPAVMPPENVLADLREMLKRTPARILLWEQAPRSEIAERLAKELQLVSVEFSPCELLGPSEIEAGLDYLKAMRRNIERLDAALSK